uniref:Uncharacterized protein n=1 Tax=Meloidogyne enterolobii TaxID=390850 RepID=A0A6V7TRE9_MELEN|nr:unnamed protein product [Meloidogyne enterolobii]
MPRTLFVTERNQRLRKRMARRLKDTYYIFRLTILYNFNKEWTGRLGQVTDLVVAINVCPQSPHLSSKSYVFYFSLCLSGFCWTKPD